MREQTTDTWMFTLNQSKLFGVLAPLADFRRTDSGTVVDAAVEDGWLHKNTITGDFADVKGLRNSNDNYLSNNVAFNRPSRRGYSYRVAAPMLHLAV